MKSVHSSHSSLTDLFPVPRFLEMPAVGLDISDEAIRIVELKKHGNQYKIGLYGEERIAKDIVEEGGYIKDKTKLIEVLSTIQKKYKLHFIKASLAEEKSYLFKTEIPVMDDADIREALKFKIEENVPMSLADAIYDFRIVKQPEPGDTTMKVSVTVVHLKVMTNYLEVFHSANLMPIELQIESQAIAHAVIPQDSKGTCIVVAIRANRTVIAIVTDGVVQFTSTLHVGGEAISQSIKEKSLRGEETTKKGRDTDLSNAMFMNLVDASSSLRDEVQKLITYWQSHSAEHGQTTQTIDKIFISGSDALLGLDTYLAQSIDIKVEIANPWVNILEIHDDLPPLTLREALDYIPVLGLALPYD